MGCGDGVLLRNAGVGADAEPQNTRNPLEVAADQGARSALRITPQGSEGRYHPDGPLEQQWGFSASQGGEMGEHAKNFTGK